MPGERSLSRPLVVMAGLDPAIHVHPQTGLRTHSTTRRRVDARIKSGHDGVVPGGQG